MDFEDIKAAFWNETVAPRATPSALQTAAAIASDLRGDKSMALLRMD